MASPEWLNRRNRFKDALGGDRPPIGVWVTTPWEGTMRILGDSGADAAFIDLEHVSYDLETAERLIVAAEAAGISPIVRPADTDPRAVTRLLDAGAHGIVFPQVETRADAERAVQCVRFRPTGFRGWGGAHTRFARWHGGYAGDVLTGVSDDPGVYSTEYVEAAEAFPAVILLVETALGVELVDEIVGVTGVDAVIFGWGDFAVESGFDHAACAVAAQAVREAAKARGVGVALSRGDTFYPSCFAVAGIDSLLMSAALGAALAQTRAAFDPAATAP